MAKLSDVKNSRAGALLRTSLEEVIERKIERERRKRALFRILAEIVLAAAATFALFTWVLGLARVDGPSMEPTLLDKAIVAYNRVGSGYKPGDIVVFEEHGQEYIKRVAAVAGDTVDITADGVVLVNGAVETYGSGETYPREGGLTFPAVVPAGCVFVLGDNRAISLDSREDEIGMVPANEIFGRVFFSMNVFERAMELVGKMI